HAHDNSHPHSCPSPSQMTQPLPSLSPFNHIPIANNITTHQTASLSTSFLAQKIQHLPFNHIPITNNIAAHQTVCTCMTNGQ
ncbi:hypothetical protein K443DRAFT_39308, partial [Laccaria amethystina LaAM-08-1]